MNSASFFSSVAVAELAEAPHSRQVIGGGRQCPLYGYFLQSAHAKPPHAALFFEDPVDWFDDGFAPRINDATHRIPQFASHAAGRPMHPARFDSAAAGQHSRPI